MAKSNFLSEGHTCTMIMAWHLVVVVIVDDRVVPFHFWCLRMAQLQGWHGFLREGVSSSKARGYLTYAL